MLIPVSHLDRQILLSHWTKLQRAVVPVTFIPPVAVYASERAGSGYWYLTGSDLSTRWYQRLSNVINRQVPVRSSPQQYWYVWIYEKSSQIQQHIQGIIDLVDRLEKKNSKESALINAKSKSTC